jgi:hypothetical protein
MLWRTFTVALAATALGWLPGRAQEHQEPDAWTVLAPVVRLNDEDRRRLAAGGTLVKVLNATQPSHLVVFATSRADVTPQQFVVRIRNSPRLWRGPKVPRTGKFGASPRVEDVAEMTLPAEDLAALRRCRPGDCAVKLSAAEMTRIGTTINNGSPNWEARAQREFREVVLERVALYRRGGLGALDRLHDHDEPIDAQTAFSRLLAPADGMERLAPDLIEYLERYPRRPLPPDAEEFLYWLETVDPPKPTIQAWHVIIDRRPRTGMADVIVISRLIFATHYVNGAVAMTALLADAGGGPHLLYLNRISADGLEGLFSGVRRYFIERRVKSGARAAFDWMRRRIEAVGTEPATGPSEEPTSGRAPVLAPR